jgi:hypothetical protein
MIVGDELPTEMPPALNGLEKAANPFLTVKPLSTDDSVSPD